MTAFDACGAPLARCIESSQLGLHLGNDLIEQGWIGDCNFRQALAIQGNPGFVQAEDKLAIPQTPFNAGGVDFADRGELQ